MAIESLCMVGTDAFFPNSCHQQSAEFIDVQLTDSEHLLHQKQRIRSQAGATCKSQAFRDFFPQHVFFEHLLHSRHCFRPGEFIAYQVRKITLFFFSELPTDCFQVNCRTTLLQCHFRHHLTVRHSGLLRPFSVPCALVPAYARPAHFPSLPFISPTHIFLFLT